MRERGPDEEAPWFFWPLIIVGTLILWTGEWLLAHTPFYVPLEVAYQACFGIVCGVLWTRMGHSLLAALSWAIPLAVFWVVVFLFVRPALLATGLHVLGLAFFFGMVLSERLVSAWYRVVLHSRPPRPPA